MSAYDKELDEAVKKHSVHPLQWLWDSREAERFEKHGINNIYDVAVHFGLLKKTRRGFRRYETICCPFHDDKTPSFVMWKKINGYKCYGCGESGTMGKLFNKLNRL